MAPLTQGWPLGLELAAARVQAFDPQTIAQEIAQNLDFLEAPERHHSMRAVFDHSWRLLTAEEQAVLRRLAVFRGGFKRGAAGQVAQASPRVLLAPIHKSLVRRNPSGRFELLEVIRQYALEKARGRAGRVRGSPRPPYGLLPEPGPDRRTPSPRPRAGPLARVSGH